MPSSWGGGGGGGGGGGITVVYDCVTTNQYGGYGIHNRKDPKKKKPLCKKDSLQCTKFIGLNFKKDNLPTKALFIGPANYSGLPLLWTPEKWPLLCSGHYEKSQSMSLSLLNEATSLSRTLQTVTRLSSHSVPGTTSQVKSHS